MPQTLFYAIPLIREDRFDPFESAPLATLRFEISFHQKRMTLQNFLQIKNAMFVILFCKKFSKVVVFCCQEISKGRVADGTESNGINLFSRIRGIVISEHGLGHLFITSCSSHFFNKTDLEQNLCILGIYKDALAYLVFTSLFFSTQRNVL